MNQVVSDGQDLRLHVPVRGPAPAMARGRRPPQSGRTGDGGRGDFCHQVRTILERTGRAADYIEVGWTPASYNPLHNDLDPYAVAYAIATLLNNLFGKSKEPFWQQAYTDLLKFVILLRRITEGYTTFADVYQVHPGRWAHRSRHQAPEGFPRPPARRHPHPCRGVRAARRPSLEPVVPRRRGIHGAPIQRRSRRVPQQAGVGA